MQAEAHATYGLIICDHPSSLQALGVVEDGEVAENGAGGPRDQVQHEHVVLEVSLLYEPSQLESSPGMS